MGGENGQKRKKKSREEKQWLNSKGTWENLLGGVVLRGRGQN